MKDRTIEIVGVLVKVALATMFIVAMVPMVGKVFKWAGAKWCWVGWAVEVISGEMIMQLAVVIIGLVTVLVLLEQAKAAKRQWRVAVWDRRYEVYKATVDLVDNIVGWNGPTKEQVEEWERRARDREWLFGADLNDIVSEMKRGWGRLVGMGEAVDDANAEGDMKRAKELAEEGKNLHKWFEEKKQKVVKLFGEYLAVKEK